MMQKHNTLLELWTQLTENIEIILCGQEDLPRMFQMHLNQVLL